ALELGVLDRQVAALGDLPALDRVLLPDLDVALGVPALLLDGPVGGPRQRAEGDVLALLGQADRHRDGDEAEADEAVPDRPHGGPPLSPSRYAAPADPSRVGTRLA